MIKASGAMSASFVKNELDSSWDKDKAERKSLIEKRKEEDKLWKEKREQIRMDLYNLPLIHVYVIRINLSFNIRVGNGLT